jgi:hypothetical protein
MPSAQLAQIAEEFGKRNHQNRTTNGIKAKLKDLGLNAARGR